jgi:hypothetical protein
VLLRLSLLPRGRASTSIAASLLRPRDSAFASGFPNLGHLCSVLPRSPPLSLALSTNLTPSEMIGNGVSGSEIDVRPVMLREIVVCWTLDDDDLVCGLVVDEAKMLSLLGPDVCG